MRQKKNQRIRKPDMLQGILAVAIGIGIIKVIYWFKWRKIERIQRDEKARK